MRMFYRKCCVAALAAFFLGQSIGQAHFIWLLPKKNKKDGKTHVEVYFGEEASPDDPAFLARIKTVKLHQLQANGNAKELKTVLTKEALTAEVKKAANKSLFVATHDLGVFERGDSKFRLKYYAKGGPSIANPAWKNVKTGKHLTFDMIPELKEDKIVITTLLNGKPVAGAEVLSIGPGDDFEGKTNDEGQVEFAVGKNGLFSIRARHIDQTAGTLDGKSYPETRHYVTAAIRVPKSKVKVPSKDISTIPQDVTSFGAAVIGDSLFTYGGHLGSAHSYSKDEQGHTLQCLDLKTNKWSDLATGPHLTGLAMVAHKGQLYRIGGFLADNKEGETHKLISRDFVARFDPKGKEWTELPPLPKPRSSHDAAVVGDTIYVAGGWNMHDNKSEWHDTALCMDLTQDELKWETLPTPPFHRRALALAAFQGKLYVIGGMKEEGGPTPRVDVYDPKTKEWGRGPDLAGDEKAVMTGFGASAFATGGNLYASTVSGDLQKLSDDGSEWKIVGLTPTARFFHRLLPRDDKHLLVVGGANMEIGKFDSIELLTVGK